jgi:DNA repair protein RadC
MPKIQIYRAALRRAGVLRVSDVEAGGSHEAARVLHAFLLDAPAERFAVLYLNNQNAIIGVECVAMGGGSQCLVTPPETFRGAIVAGATRIIIGHNHPSGDPMPSPDDIFMTENIVAAGKVVGIVVLDHIVVTRDPSRWSSILDRYPEIFE